MARNYTVSTRIKRPVEEVFKALVSADQQVRYFTDRSSGDLQEGQVVTWFWQQWGENQVAVVEVIPHRRIVLSIDSVEWEKTVDDSYEVRIVFELEALEDGSTRLSISEQGWKQDAAGIKASHQNCEGWTHMCACLKAYLEHGIDLR
ncbi:MAG: SRPBCC domain-containing protein [Xanthomonadales bacterium]|nr:SRPBCC domain-containing protein [Xanthomonadales bacterium]